MGPHESYRYPLHDLGEVGTSAQVALNLVFAATWLSTQHLRTVSAAAQLLHDLACARPSSPGDQHVYAQPPILGEANIAQSSCQASSSPRSVTRPWFPSTITRCPSVSFCVPSVVPITAGIPYSRATMAACDAAPPPSTTTAAAR